jgi:hypothetical protein
MSLEAKIEALTQAVIELKNAMVEGRARMPPEANQTAEPEVRSPITEMIHKSEVQVEKSEVAKRTLTYFDVKAATLKVAKADRAKAIAILESFNVKRADELKEDQWADYIGKCEGA